MEWHKQFKSLLLMSVLLICWPIGKNVAFAEEKSLIPMGHSISIQMDLSGVYLANDILLQKDQWLKAGDLIEQVDETAITDVSMFEQLLTKSQANQDRTLHVTRKGKAIDVGLDDEMLLRLLPFLKDRTEGTGTLTYVDPKNNAYGALGHQIIDSALQSPPAFKNGTIHLSTIEQIRKSTPGNPGYKISTIVDDTEMLGTIQKNIVYGIFGSWNVNQQKVLTEPLQIMKQSEIKAGEAEIYTTINGTDVESFTIDITNVKDDQFHFTLTDEVLLEKTGGILQGMSGSPIIQDGKFAGAITHMFIDEPEKGAAISLETMQKGV